MSTVERPTLTGTRIPADYPAGRIVMARDTYREMHADYKARIDGEPAAMVWDGRPRGEWPFGSVGTALVIVELV